MLKLSLHKWLKPQFYFVQVYIQINVCGSGCRFDILFSLCYVILILTLTYTSARIYISSTFYGYKITFFCCYSITDMTSLLWITCWTCFIIIVSKSFTSATTTNIFFYNFQISSIINVQFYRHLIVFNQKKKSITFKPQN